MDAVTGETVGEAGQIQSLLQSDLAVQLPLHISLSRSMALPTDQRQMFLETLEALLNDAAIQP